MSSRMLGLLGKHLFHSATRVWGWAKEGSVLQIRNCPSAGSAAKQAEATRNF